MEIKKLESGFTQIMDADGNWIIVDTIIATSEELGVALSKDAPEPSKEEVKEEKAVEKEETQDDFYTMEDLDDMNKEELTELIDDEDLGLDPADFRTTKKLRLAIAEELGLDED